MTKSKRLGPIVKIANDRERHAAKALGDAQRVVNERHAKLAELENYRREYQARFIAEHTASAFQIGDFQVFLRRLDEIIGEQRRLLAQSENELENKRQEWLEVKSKAQALDKAVERFRDEERAQADKREQRDTDERAQRRNSRAEE